MKNNQHGFVGPALIIASAVIGAATLAVKNSQTTVNLQIESAEVKRDQEQIRDAAMSLASRYKAVLAERKSGSGRYAPAVYAEDYFAYNWKLMKNPDIAEKLGFVVRADGSVWMDGNGSFEKDWDRALDTIKGIKSKDQLGTDTYSLRITDTYRRKTGAGAGIVVEHVDVEIKQQFESDMGKKDSITRVRVPVPVPKPYGGKIFFRNDQTSGDFEELKSGDQIGEGDVEFEVRGSGIAIGAKLFINNVENKLGYTNFNSITHNLRNYDAVNRAFPGRIKRNFSSKVNIKVVDAEWDPTQTDCRMSLTDKSLSLRLELIGVDGDIVSYPAINIKTSDGRQNLSLNDYQNKCTAKGQCPYVGDSTDPMGNPNGDAINAYWLAHGGGKIDDVSSLWNYTEAMRFGLKDRKLCMRLDHKKISQTDPKYIEKSDMITYSLDTCKAKFLHERTACGCVAEDTLITMGDGKTQKRVDQLAETDLIWNPIKKKAMAMRKMTRGPEKIPMIKILVDGKVLKVTGNHPFPTRSGMSTAFRLEEGQEILLNGDQWVKIENIEPIKAEAKAPIVWNIEIEAPDDDWDAHHYVANGVVTGDLMIQVALGSKRLASTP